MNAFPDVYIIIAVAGLIAIAIVSAALLHGWNGWLALRHAEIAQRQGGVVDGTGGPVSAATRIDMADLKERIRKLEAIAAGVDL